jgi:hypothetical protein
VGLLGWLRSRTSFVPLDVRPALDAEGVVVEHPNVSASITYENYRAPGVRSGWRKTLVRGALVDTGTRLAFYTGHGPFVNVPLTDDRFDQLDLAVDGAVLAIGFDAHLFDEQRSGRITVRVHVPEPDRALEWLQSERRRAREQAG